MYFVFLKGYMCILEEFSTLHFVEGGGSTRWLFLQLHVCDASKRSHKGWSCVGSGLNRNANNELCADQDLHLLGLKILDIFWTIYTAL